MMPSVLPPWRLRAAFITAKRIDGTKDNIEAEQKNGDEKGERGVLEGCIIGSVRAVSFDWGGGIMGM